MEAKPTSAYTAAYKDAVKKERDGTWEGPAAHGADQQVAKAPAPSREAITATGGRALGASQPGGEYASRRKAGKKSALVDEMADRRAAERAVDTRPYGNSPEERTKFKYSVPGFKMDKPGGGKEEAGGERKYSVPEDAQKKKIDMDRVDKFTKRRKEEEEMLRRRKEEEEG